MDEELKPCPFCGGAVHMDVQDGSTCVNCDGCGMSFTVFEWFDWGESEKTIAAWNKRAPLRVVTVPDSEIYLGGDV
jgi:Lar family restriction alleviation protein